MRSSILLQAFATSALAASIPRQTYPSFYIDDFYFSSIAYNKDVTYSMKVSFEEMTTNCSIATNSETLSQLCSTTAPYAPAIDGFTPKTCSDPAFSWSLTPSTSGTLAGGYSFQVNYTTTSGDVLSACYGIEEKNLACYTQGDEHSMDQEDYIGAHNFTAQASTTNQCIYA